MNTSVTRRGFGWTLAVLLATLLFFFWRSLMPGQTLFSNDGPLGRLEANCHLLPGAFTGVWEDLNTVGYREEGPVPGVSSGLRYVLGPVAFSKLYAPIALLILGVGAWCFLRQLGLAPVACGLGALAAMLNSSFFSAACWGVAAHPIMLGMIFFALAALLDTSSKMRWLRVALAGLAVGMGVNEAADIGAIFSIFVALFVLYQAWIEEGSKGKRMLRGGARLAVLVAFALFMAAQAVFALVETQIEGIAGTAQDTETKQEHWDWATQWSLPKREILGLAVPGLFGYRMTSPHGAAYWGAVGRDATWERYLAAGRTGPDPKGFIRFTGGGIYCGVLVLLLGVWASVHGFQKKEPLFKPRERQWLRFWTVVIVVSLLLSFGRFAPFYRWLYALPYFSTIRNPTKFLHVLSFALIILFAYGVDGLARAYMKPVPRPKQRWAGLAAWWKAATSFEKRWLKGCALALAVTLVAWIIYNGSRKNVTDYLATVGFDENNAAIIAGFSIAQVGWFVLFFTLAALAMTLTFSGAFAGPRAGKATIVLGLLLLIDLGRANLPWLVYFDYVEKYSSNPILDALRDKPYEHRVGNLPTVDPSRDKVLFELYRREWAQHEFPFFNIQSLDIVQLPRQPADLQAYDKALSASEDTGWEMHIHRRWELTNTRYFLGNARLPEIANVQIDPQKRRFRTVQRFNIVAKPGVIKPESWKDLQIELAPEGRFALIEFAGALPRASLYTHWISSTNDQAVLKELTSESFHPENTVLVSGPTPAPPALADTNTPARKVEFESYAPRDIVLRAEASQASVLLLNDRLDRYWNVAVDGKPDILLRCNYLMRGVWLPSGSHRVRFRFQPPIWPVWVSLAANGVGLALLGVLLVTGRAQTEQPQKLMQPATKQKPEPERACQKATA